MDNDLMLSMEFIKAHPVDAAQILERLQVEETNALLKKAPPLVAATVIKFMDAMYATQCLETLGIHESGAIIAELPLKMASVLLRRIAQRRMESILEMLPPATAKDLRTILRYSEDMAGALMDSDVLMLPEDITVEEALGRIQKHPKQVTHYIYVVNRERILVGFIELGVLMRADPGSYVSAVMHTKPTKLSAHLSKQAIVMHPGWGEFHTLPVVDRKDIFLGTLDYHTLRSLESASKNIRDAEPVNTVAKALGELYLMGLFGLIKGAALSMDRQ